MDHGDYLVDVFDREGRISGQKPRREIDKFTDIYNAVHVLLVTPWGELVLSAIPEREYLPNLYTGKFSTTAATLRRHGESAGEAATRAVERELLIRDAPVVLLGEKWLVLSDGLPRQFSAYYLVTETPKQFSNFNIGAISILMPDQFQMLLDSQPDRFSPTLQALWQHFGAQIPAGD